MRRSMDIKSDDLIFALDIGTTKICALTGYINDYNKVEIIASGIVESTGVNRGVISNIDKTVSAIEKAISYMKKTANVDCKKIHVGIAGQHIRSMQNSHTMMRDFPQTEISLSDVERLNDQMNKLMLPPGEKILHIIPQEYTIDNEQGILDPKGMFGAKMEANFHIITAQDASIKNISKCVEKVGLEVATMTLEPIASSLAVLSDKEKEAGVLLVDIGGGTTDLTIFQDGIIRHTAVIPFGGNVITKDIKEGCQLLADQAELLKIKHGTAVSSYANDNTIYTVEGINGNHKEIPEKILAKIIEARMSEILDFVLFEIKKAGYERKLLGGIVLTGGGSLLKDIEKLTQYYTGYDTRIGIPSQQLAQGYDRMISSPVFATAIGLLIKGAEEQAKHPSFYKNEIIETPKADDKVLETAVSESASVEEQDDDDVSDEPKAGIFHKFFKQVKEFFDAEPDQDF